MKRTRIASALRLAGLLGLAGLPGAACGGDGEVASPRRTFESDVHECQVRQRAVYQGLIEMRSRLGWQPAAGDALPGVLTASGHWPPAAETPDPRLTCPGGGYAGRDLAAFPLERFPTSGKEVLMACANAGGPNHQSGEVNVLFADGSVRTLTVTQEIEAGRLPAGTPTIPVGPGSPLKDLAKLSLP